MSLYTYALRRFSNINITTTFTDLTKVILSTDSIIGQIKCSCIAKKHGSSCQTGQIIVSIAIESQRNPKKNIARGMLSLPLFLNVYMNLNTNCS